MIWYRTYDGGYEQYLRTQGIKAKLHADEVLARNGKRTRYFTRQFKIWERYMRRGRVLCLGSRTNCEVQAAIAIGFRDSVGLDLHPMSPGMICADWHQLPIADACVQNVFTNALDHSIDIGQMVREAFRVLVPGGAFVFETHKDYAMGRRDRREWGFGDMLDHHRFNAAFWDDVQDLLVLMQAAGFVLSYSNLGGKMSSFVLHKEDIC